MVTSPLRIGFNGRPFCQKSMRGLSRHTLELIKGLKHLDPSLEIFVYTYGEISKFYKDALPFVHFRERRVFPKILWDIFFLNYDVWRDRLDLFHSTNNVGVPWLYDLPTIVTIHDHFSHVVRWPWGRSVASWWAAMNYRIELWIVRRASAYITVSHSAKDEVSQRIGLSPERVDVIYNGVSLPLGLISQPRGEFFLYVGGLENRKNILVMLRGFRKFLFESNTHYCLKIVGSLAGACAEVLDELKAHPDIFLLSGPISDDQLAELYQQANALLFPSLEEGFGLPLVEAMALRCPAIVSDIPVFREIAKDAAMYFSPSSEDELSLCLRQLQGNLELREQLVNLGAQRVKQFTWTEMVRRVYALYLAKLKKKLESSAAP